MSPIKYLLRVTVAVGVSFIAAGCADIEVDDDHDGGHTRTTTTTVEERHEVPATTTRETVVRY